MMLGFVVRRCAAAVGHHPSAEEFAAWANGHRTDGLATYLFGRPISTQEAQLILRRPGRPVTARSATAAEQLPDDDVPAGSNVTSFAAAAARLKARRK
jgi:hypothetical protein